MKEVITKMEKVEENKEGDLVKSNLDILLIIIGLAVFMFASNIQTQTGTDLDYSTLGGFLFLAGLLLLLKKKK
jgi:LPXTG-motif cell wall-anchored protein